MENLLDWSVRDRRQYFFSLQGVLKIIEIILVIVTLGLARGGDGGFSVLADYVFIVVGTTMFLTITLLIYIVSTLFGDQPPVLLDSMTTMIGGILMITAGALTLSYSSKAVAFGVVAIIAGIILVVDFLLSLKTLQTEKTSSR